MHEAQVLRETVESFGKISDQCFIFFCLVHRSRKTFHYDFKDNLGRCILFRKSQRKFKHVFSKQSKIYQNTHFTKIFQRLVYISFKRKICKWISIFFDNFCQQIVTVAVCGSFRVYQIDLPVSLMSVSLSFYGMIFSFSNSSKSLNVSPNISSNIILITISLLIFSFRKAAWFAPIFFFFGACLTSNFASMSLVRYPARALFKNFCWPPFFMKDWVLLP